MLSKLEREIDSWLPYLATVALVVTLWIIYDLATEPGTVLWFWIQFFKHPIPF